MLFCGLIQCTGEFTNEQIPAGPKQFTARASETALINIHAGGTLVGVDWRQKLYKHSISVFCEALKLWVRI